MNRVTVALLSAAMLAAPSAAEEPMIREFESQGYRVRLQLGAQVLRLDAPEERDWSHDDSRGPAEAAILPKLPHAAGGCLSAAALAEKAKQFDDGLYAAVEFAAQQGAGTFGGKAYLLKAVADELAKHITSGPPDGAATTFFSAARLGDIPAVPPAALEVQVSAVVEAFRQDALRSKPISFYTWSRSLESIFQQDRMLQSELLGKPEIEQLVAALTADPRARTTYDSYLALVERLTNPFVSDKPDLRQLLATRGADQPAIPSRGVFFFPPSRAHETELIKKLYGSSPIPEGFDLANELIGRVRNGKLDLTPTKESGWYDYQTWALEPLAAPLAAPEAQRLQFGPGYERQLAELFKGVLARTRETHIKQLEIPTVGSAAPGPHDREPVIIRVQPDLSVEPLATYYLRRAESYRFIRGVLEGTFGAAGVRAIKMWSPDGQSDRSLADELDNIQRLFLGAHLTACGQIGLRPGQPEQALADAGAAARTAFTNWSAAAESDPDLGRDGRMMVPVFFDQGRGKTKVWVFLGWSTKSVNVSYATEPKAEVFDAAGKPVALSDHLQLHFDDESYALAYPVMAEVYVTQILNRTEFAAHCDQHKTRKAILENLK